MTEKLNTFVVKFRHDGELHDYSIKAKDLFDAGNYAQQVAKDRNWLHISTDTYEPKQIKKYDFNAPENKHDDIHKFTEAIKNADKQDKYVATYKQDDGVHSYLISGTDFIDAEKTASEIGKEQNWEHIATSTHVLGKFTDAELDILTNKNQTEQNVTQTIKKDVNSSQFKM